MVADRTGGGKSLILSMTAICVAGVTLVVVPLLALTANRLARLNLADQRYAAITALHLGETLGDNLHNMVIPKMDGLSYHSLSSLLLLCLPQYLAETKKSVTPCCDATCGVHCGSWR